MTALFLQICKFFISVSFFCGMSDHKICGIFISEVKKTIKQQYIFFKYFFIAQIQVAQQYSSLTAQNNSMAVTRKAWIHQIN